MEPTPELEEEEEDMYLSFIDDLYDTDKDALKNKLAGYFSQGNLF